MSGDLQNNNPTPRTPTIGDVFGAVLALLAMLGLLYVAGYVLGAGLHAGGLG